LIFLIRCLDKLIKIKSSAKSEFKKTHDSNHQHQPKMQQSPSGHSMSPETQTSIIKCLNAHFPDSTQNKTDIGIIYQFDADKGAHLCTKYNYLAVDKGEDTENHFVLRIDLIEGDLMITHALHDNTAETKFSSSRHGGNNTEEEINKAMEWIKQVTPANIGILDEQTKEQPKKQP
jgi:hypothetical protein